MSGPYLYRGIKLQCHGFFKALFDLRLGSYRGSPRVPGHGGVTQEHFASRVSLN